MRSHRVFALVAVLAVAAGCATLTLQTMQSRIDTASSPCRTPKNVVHVPITVGGLAGVVVGGFESGPPDRDWLTGEERPLPGARVVLRELGGVVLVQEVRSDDAGGFALDPPLPGLYQLEACYPGFLSTFVPVRIVAGAEPTALTIGLELARE